MAHDAAAEGGREGAHGERREGDAERAAGDRTLVEEPAQPDEARVHRQRRGVDVEVTGVDLDGGRLYPPAKT